MIKCASSAAGANDYSVLPGVDAGRSSMTDQSALPSVADDAHLGLDLAPSSTTDQASIQPGSSDHHVLIAAPGSITQPAANGTSTISHLDTSSVVMSGGTPADCSNPAQSSVLVKMFYGSRCRPSRVVVKPSKYH
jgi:hypothetical protein